MAPTTSTTKEAPSREPVNMVKAWERSMAPPSSRVSDEAATGEPESTMQAPSQPRPRVLQALSVKMEPEREGMRAAAPPFMIPSAITNRPKPRTPQPILAAMAPARLVLFGASGRAAGSTC